MYCTGIFSVPLQVAICPDESQFLPLQSACQKIQTYRTSNSEGDRDLGSRPYLPSISCHSLLRLRLSSSLQTTWFDSSCFCACWSLSTLVKAWAFSLCLFWFDMHKRERNCKQNLASPVFRVPAEEPRLCWRLISFISSW